MAKSMLVSYGMVILSFMGGCRWGFAAAGLGEGSTYRLFAIAVLPALYAWPMGHLAFEWAALGLAAGFLALFVADRVLTLGHGAPAWWSALWRFEPGSELLPDF